MGKICTLRRSMYSGVTRCVLLPQFPNLQEHPAGQEGRVENETQVASQQGVASGSTSQKSNDKKRDDQEPWDCDPKNYPITIPFRRPDCGDPDLLDKHECEEALKGDKKAVSTASELGLLEEDDKSRMLIIELPPDMPKGVESTNGSSQERDDKRKKKEKCMRLEQLPEGKMGKMMVYKSGAVKLKLGDVVFNVSSRRETSCAQNIMAINVEDTQCADLGQVYKRAYVSLDWDFLLD